MSEPSHNGKPRKFKQDKVDFELIGASALRSAHALAKTWLPDGRREGDEWVARNPTRPDNRPGSFKVNLVTGAWADFATGDKGGDLISLRAYLDGTGQVEAARAIAAELGIALDAGAPAGLTIEAYAAAKKLPFGFLAGLGLRTIENPYKQGSQALAIPYRKPDGSLFRERIRQALHKPANGKDKRMLWDKRPEKLGAMLYGLEQLPARGCPVLLVEGESDCHTLWFRERDAVGAPGAGNYSPSRDDEALEGFDLIALIEPDQGGRALLKKLASSKLRKSIRIARLDGFKDVSELHLRAPERFDDVLDAAIAIAEPLNDVLAQTPGVNPKADRDKPSGVSLDGAQADVLVGLALEGAEFFATPDEIACAVVKMNDHGETWSLRSRGFKQWLVHRFYKATGKAPNGESMTQALLNLEAHSHIEGPKRAVHIRTAAHEGKLYVDLADELWRAIEIDAKGWRIVADPPVRFVRPRGLLPLAAPVRGGTVSELRNFLNLASDDDFILIVAFLLAALRPIGPFPLLALTGEPGAAKSTTARVLRSIVDPNVAGLRSSPREERDCWIACANSALLAFDNLSAIPAWLSDALCRVATGGAFAARQLHTDTDEVLIQVMRPIILTAVGDVIARSDLADRAMIVTLPSIPAGRRRAEAQFNEALAEASARILGALLDAMALGLNRLPQVSLPELPRLADFACWGTACETAFTEPGGVMTAFNRNMAEAVHSVIEGDSVCVAVLKLLDAHSGKWKGKPETLLELVGNFAPDGARREKDFPRNPQSLSNRLRLAAPSLRKVNINIDRGKTHGDRWISIIRG